jgi:predicted SAM-dependent methyltransferase
MKNLLCRLLGKDKQSLQIQHLKCKMKGNSLNVVVGASGIFENGWIETNIDLLNLLKKRDWKKLFKPGTINIILAEHVWEHLTMEEGKIALSYCYKYLKKGGHIRLAVPDGFHPNMDYIDYVKPGGYGAGANDHKVLYNYKLLKNCLEESSFKVKLLEYFDEMGKFHFNQWDTKDGMVWRSKDFDERNIVGQLNYTSLIVDGIK